MGLPVHRFIASTNRNRAVPDYLIVGNYVPKQTHHTITNAMDVGDPSNFPLMLEIYGKQHSAMASDIDGYWFTDDETRAAMAILRNVYSSSRRIFAWRCCLCWIAEIRRT